MANLYGQYVWLIDTIRSAGRITKAEIDRRWAKSSLNEKHEDTYPLRSFHRVFPPFVPSCFVQYGTNRADWELSTPLQGAEHARCTVDF